MPVEDRYRTLARAELLERIEMGRLDSTTYKELGDRTPSQALRAGDRPAVERLIDKWFADAESKAERRRDDPKFMDMMERRRKALIARRAELAKRRPA